MKRNEKRMARKTIKIDKKRANRSGKLERKADNGLKF